MLVAVNFSTATSTRDGISIASRTVRYILSTRVLLLVSRPCPGNNAASLFFNSHCTVRTAFSDHSKKQSYSEHIYEFERVGSFHLKVRLGTVDYDKDKRWLVKVLYEGDVH